MLSQEEGIEIGSDPQEQARGSSACDVVGRKVHGDAVSAVRPHSAMLPNGGSPVSISCVKSVQAYVVDSFVSEHRRRRRGRVFGSVVEGSSGRRQVATILDVKVGGLRVADAPKQNECTFLLGGEQPQNH